MDPTKSTEENVQRRIRKIKSKLTIQEYKRLYPIGSSPGKFCGTEKLHKIDSKRLVDELPIRPIISNRNTSTYHLSKYVAKLLAPLRMSQYSIKSTKVFMSIIKTKKFQMVIRWLLLM